jgi:ParB-like nuclease family protein
LEIFSSDVSLPLQTILDANPAWNRDELGSLDDLELSVRRLGLTLPVLVTPDVEVIDGARRVEVAYRLGMSTVPVKTASTWQEVVDYFIQARGLEASGLPFKPLKIMEFGSLVNGCLYRLLKRDSVERANETKRLIKQGKKVKPRAKTTPNVLLAEMFGMAISDVIVRRDIWSKTNTCTGLGLGAQARELIADVEAGNGRLYSLQAALADLANGRPTGRRRLYRDKRTVTIPVPLVDVSPDPQVAKRQVTKIENILLQLSLIGDEVRDLGPLNRGIEPETAIRLAKSYHAANRKVTPLRQQLLEMGTTVKEDSA